MIFFPSNYGNNTFSAIYSASVLTQFVLFFRLQFQKDMRNSVSKCHARNVHHTIDLQPNAPFLCYFQFQFNDLAMDKAISSTNAKKIDDLSEDILLRIFDYLPIKELCVSGR